MANTLQFPKPAPGAGVRGRPRDFLLHGLVEFYRDVLTPEFDAKTGRLRPLDGAPWDIRHHYAMVVPAQLWAWKSPDNPYWRSRDALAMCIGLGDYLTGVQDTLGRFPEEGVFGSAEWPAYYLARCCLILGRSLPTASRRRWHKAIRSYLAYQFPKSFVTGAPNHNAWRCLALYVGGKALADRTWMARGLWSAHQLAAHEYPGGFYDEPQRHHGPSMHYLSGITRPMTILAMDSGDPVVAGLAGRVRDFLIRFSQPDGGTLGCLDSRCSAWLFQFNVGFATSPAGRRLNRLGLATAHRLGLRAIADQSPHLHHAHSVAAAMADSLAFWPGGREAPLPQESDGYATRFDFGLLSASLSRRLGWTVGLNGGIAETQLRAATPTTIDPQNRLDIWHHRAGLIIGGGPVSVHAPADPHRSADLLGALPMANVAIVTGFGDTAEATCDFGLARANDPRWIRGMFYPMAARIIETGRRNVLRLDFTHATATMTVEPIAEAGLTICADIRHCGARRLIVQFPVVVPNGHALATAGQRLENGNGPARCLPVGASVERAGGGARVRIRLPGRCANRLWWPAPGGVGYSCALISSQVDRPAERVVLRYRIDVAGNPEPVED